MLNIVMMGDGRTLAGMELVIYSTMLHNKNIHWYILTMDAEVSNPQTGEVRVFYGLNQEQCDWLNYIVEFMDKNSRFTVYDCKNIYEDNLKGAVNEGHSFAPHTGLRLLLDKIIPEERCLSLDADIIVQSAIDDMYEKYAQGNYDLAAYYLPEACEDYGELNGGVLLFNLKNCRKSGMLERARIFYRQQWYRFTEQGVLADVCDADSLPTTYNYMYNHKYADYKPAILHFTCHDNTKIYSTTEGLFYRYYPEHVYLREGLKKIKSSMQSIHKVDIIEPPKIDKDGNVIIPESLEEKMVLVEKQKKKKKRRKKKSKKSE